MEFLGIGLPELLMILIVTLIVLGPGDMAKTGRMVGRTLNKIIRSPTWRSIQQIWWEIRNAPTRMMREANLEEVQETFADLQKSQKDIIKSIKTGDIKPPDFQNQTAAQDAKKHPSAQRISSNPNSKIETPDYSTWVTPTTDPKSAEPDTKDSSPDLTNWITPPQNSSEFDPHL